jgi:hypothetical protein
MVLSRMRRKKNALKKSTNKDENNKSYGMVKKVNRKS